MIPLQFGRQVTGNLDESATREWLVTDGLGGFAMGTVAGLRTRRYHALLVVAGEPIGRRMVGLAALDTIVVAGDRRLRLATHEWAGGTIDPVGHLDLESFEIVEGVPRWRWVFGDIAIEREVAMAHGRPLVAVTTKVLRAPGPVRLETVALCTWRDAHGERFGHGDAWVEAVADGFMFEHAFRVKGPGWQPGGTWYRGCRYRVEADRGLPDTEDLWAAGTFVATVDQGDSVDIVACADDFSGPLPPAREVVLAARGRSHRVAAAARAADDVDETLAHAADQLVVTTTSGPTVVAGYPWFGEWSRDTMTSYEGLFLVAGRADEGRELLLRASDTLSEGMLSNTADAGGLEYNTADATLWFLHAIGRHVDVTGDVDLAAKLDESLDQVIECHMSGTRYGIKVDSSDGLLAQGAPGTALTWMDARVDGVPITPRAGKAVEINALWINALATVSGLHRRLGRHTGRWQALEDFARTSFERRFSVTRPGGAAGLLDTVDGPAGRDDKVRPNQLLAVSLPHGPAPDRTVVELCRSSLLTSLGLRSLAPDDPDYIGHHRGNGAERDRAYHQGTVWPWLIGPYVEAALRTGVDADGALDGLERHLGEWGLGSVSETADGNAPHRATGCPFQAWSVAELMRARHLLAR